MHAYRCVFRLVSLTLAFAAWPAPAVAQAANADVAARLKVWQDAGDRAPLTIYPVRVLGRPTTNVAEALGLVLERYGMSDLEIAEKAFDAADTAWDALPAVFKAHVQQAGATSPLRHSLYAEFLGEPRGGPTEVRFLLVDGTGELVLTDRQSPTDKAWKRTAGRDPDPLGCSTLVAERLFALSEWKKTPGKIIDGKFASRWRTKSGVPDKAGLAAMEKRRTALRSNLKNASIAVLPSLAMASPDAASASRLAELIGTELGCRAAAVPDGAALQVAPSSNEQKRLWDLVSALGSVAAKQAGAADYVLVADLAVRPEGGRGFVHVVLATKGGEVVLADYQNDQHPMFQKHAPKSVADAEELVVARLAHLLR